MFVKPTKDAASSKDTSSVNPTDGKPVDTTAAQKTSTGPPDSAEVEEYRAKLAEKRRLAREKAELEAEQEEERRRQQQ